MTPLPKSTLRLAQSQLNSAASKKASKQAKSLAGKKGMAVRWAHVPRCPACRRPATKEQREAMKATQHGAQEVKVL